MRAVLDTTVLLSALAFPGSKPDRALDSVRRREAELFLSSLADERVGTIRRMATLVEPRERIDLVKAKDDDNCRCDPYEGR